MMTKIHVYEKSFFVREKQKVHLRVFVDIIVSTFQPIKCICLFFFSRTTDMELLTRKIFPAVRYNETSDFEKDNDILGNLTV
jgi:hypothetical protein